MPEKTDRCSELVEKCLGRIQGILGHSSGGEWPKLALILGSGFEAVLPSFKILAAIGFDQLPGFPQPKVEGHAGRLLLAEIGTLRVWICSGRAHFYEGHAMDAVMFPTRVLAALGVEELLLTNAAGGLNSSYRPGDFMLFTDHINFTGANPLRGCGDLTAFLDLSDAYSPRLRSELIMAGRAARVRLHEGIYLGVSGPSYETPAEIRMFRQWGADAVGMSTIPEVLMARASGIEVAALSCITNYAAGMRNQKLSHADVLANGRQSAAAAARWFMIFAGTRSKFKVANDSPVRFPGPKDKAAKRQSISSGTREKGPKGG
ncbi:MAG TPA: purine-nucleoside phosphorylase [Verrucomicrobiae bacterium]|nr:purine-nucleoside phosphorylase [Verrucomicrobiae bacterium]